MSTLCKKQEKKKKQAEIDRKRAEVRARMEEASKAKKAKKGFMTPERKKKLRVSDDFAVPQADLIPPCLPCSSCC